MGWPLLGMVHKDGSRFVGRALGQVQPYWAAGTPVVNKMLQTSVDAGAVARVRIGDRLQVLFDGSRHWWVYRDGSHLGRLTWTLSLFEPKDWVDRSAARIDDGSLEVTQLLLNARGTVINCGGLIHRR